MIRLPLFETLWNIGEKKLDELLLRARVEMFCLHTKFIMAVESALPHPRAFFWNVADSINPSYVVRIVVRGKLRWPGWQPLDELTFPEFKADLFRHGRWMDQVIGGRP